jgi:hypothetical protein
MIRGPECLSVWKMSSHFCSILTALALIVPLCSHLARAATFVVNQRNPNSTDTGPGTESQPFKTIAPAAERAQPGDTVLVHAGIYRERLTPARGGEEGHPITYQAAPSENVVIRGSEIWRPKWTVLDASRGVFKANFESVIRDGFNPFKIQMRGDVGKKTLGQIFIDGKFLWEVGREEELLATEGTWMVASDGTNVLVHFPASDRPPQQRQVEVTVRNRLFAPARRGLGYIHVDGFVFEHCANQFPGNGFWESDSPQAGAVSCRGGHHWVFEKNTIRRATGFGLDCGTEGKFDTEGLRQPEPDVCGYHLIRNNTISDNGAGGIGAYRSPFTRIIGNVLERNNYMNSNEASEDAAIKTHFFINGLIEDNLIRDNETHGIWLDNVYQGTRVTRNLILNNKRSGIMCEMGSVGCLIDNNVIAFTRAGDGIYTQDASDVSVVHNLLYDNANYGLYMRYMVDRAFNVYPASFKTFKDSAIKIEHVACSGQRVLNNLFIGNHRGALSLIFPGERAKDNRSDSNVYVTYVPFERQYAINLTAGGNTVADIQKAFDTGAKRSNRDTSLPTLAPFPEGVEVTLDQWRYILGCDIKSAVLRHGEVTHTLNTVFPEFSFKTSPALFKVKCDPIDGVDKDFFGNRIGRAPIIPGPFQNLKEGPNAFALWQATSDLAK